MFNKYFGIALSIIACCSVTSCASINDFTSNMTKKLSGSTTFDEKNFEPIPFEKAVNRSFESELKSKKFKFDAIYRGTVPNPGELKSVKGYTNLKMCDKNKKEVCSDLIVIKNSEVDPVFSLLDNSPVVVYATILSVAGVGSDSTGYIGFEANNMSAPYMYINAQKVAATESTTSLTNQNGNKSLAAKAANPDAKDIAAAQTILNNKGYNTGSVDGKIGPKTHAAISNFQRDNSLPVTGDLNHDTILKLREYAE